jgi:hypothetical protein
MTPHQAKHSTGELYWGVNGDTGKIVDMRQYGLLESASVKVCTNLTYGKFSWLTFSPLDPNT